MIEPRRITWVKIRELAEDFRDKYVEPPDLVPVPIENIIEFKLDIEIWPLKNLKGKSDIEAFLSHDLKTITVDENLYSDDRYVNRLRFTLAHEVGHIIIHSEEITGLDFKDINGWMAFREGMDEDDLNWFEQQAYEFAGRLLVPKERLITELEKLDSKIREFINLSGENNEDMIIQAVSRKICDVFGVSEDVIKKRIRNEKIWEELGL